MAAEYTNMSLGITERVQIFYCHLLFKKIYAQLVLLWKAVLRDPVENI